MYLVIFQRNMIFIYRIPTIVDNDLYINALEWREQISRMSIQYSYYRCHNN
jgi:hypothetical protein